MTFLVIPTFFLIFADENNNKQLKQKELWKRK